MASASAAGRLVVLYDRDCGLCLATARLLGRWDRSGLLDLVALQQASLDPRPAVRAAAARRALERELHAVDVAGSGAVAAGGDAVLAVVGRLPGGRVPAAILGVPPFRWTVAVGYRLVAANRHRIGRLVRLEGPGCLVDPGRGPAEGS
jgi:predicted DCC family thiol-disulfide oxidoreductase YuxK